MTLLSSKTLSSNPSSTLCDLGVVFLGASVFPSLKWVVGALLSYSSRVDQCKLTLFWFLKRSQEKGGKG